MKITIGLVDDHQLFSKSLAMLLSSFPDFQIVVEASNGIDLQEKLKTADTIPDIMLIDVTMPMMDGVATAKWLNENYPTMRLVALSMNDKEQTILDMLQAGCCSYLLKDTHPEELDRAIKEVYTKNFYDSILHDKSLAKLIIQNQNSDQLQIGEREHEFLKLAASDRTYKEIASTMNLSERTIDGYRASLFTKLNVQSRTGMVLEGFRRGIINFN